MRYSLLTWLSCCLLAAEGFTHHQALAFGPQTTAFVGQSCQTTKSCTSRAASLKMDMEEPYAFNSDTRNQEVLKRYNVPFVDRKQPLQVPKPASVKNVNNNKPIDDALQKHGMPWKSSIDPTYPSEEGLFYMEFFEWQMNFLKENLTNLRLLPTESKTGDDLSYVESDERSVRMVTLCFASDEYRKIRMTVYDAGNRTQVFTSLWYPQPEYNLPVLGTDLLQFNHDRHLCVVDFQPIQSSEQEHAQPYEHILKPIRDLYPSLQGQMTKRFYDENHFFSNQMLYSRFEELHNANKESSSSIPKEDHPAYRDLFPAYQEYVKTHLQLIQSATPQKEDSATVKKAQAAYDTYSADRDPAHAMFSKVFGPKFADSFVYDVLFSYSEGEERE